MKPQTYFKTMKILASIAIISQSLYYSIIQPGPMDTINALVASLVIFAIWFAKERAK